MTNEIVLYKPNEQFQLEVQLKDETVWLTQDQMSQLFDRDRTVIGRHIRNIFSEGELDESLVCAKFALPKKYGRRDGLIQYIETTLSNLDVIISVGYRVKSLRGTQFRIWANSILKQYLNKGYVINQQRLDHYNELKEVVHLMSRAITLQETVHNDEYAGLFNVISDYVYALDTLDHYDFQELQIEKTTKNEPFHATYENAMEAINVLKKKFGGSALFANE